MWARIHTDQVQDAGLDGNKAAMPSNTITFWQLDQVQDAGLDENKAAMPSNTITFGQLAI